MKKKILLAVVIRIVAITTVAILAACDGTENQLYAVTITQSEHGTVTADKTAAKEGDTVTLTVTPEANYKLIPGSLKVNDVAIEGYAFVMSAKDVNITAEFFYGKDVASLTLDNVYENLIDNCGTFNMTSLSYNQQMTIYRNNTILSAISVVENQDYDIIYFQQDGKVFSSSKPYEFKRYEGKDFKIRFYDYYELFLTHTLFENAGKFYVEDGESFVIAQDKHNEYYDAMIKAGHLIEFYQETDGDEFDIAGNRDYFIELFKTIRITLNKDNTMEMQLTYNGDNINLVYHDIGNTIINVPEEAINAPILEYISLHFIEGINIIAINGMEVVEGQIITEKELASNYPKGYIIAGVYTDREMTQAVELPYVVSDINEKNIELYFDLQYIGQEIAIVVDNNQYIYVYVEGEATTLNSVKSYLKESYKLEIINLFNDEAMTDEFRDYVNMNKYIGKVLYAKLVE